MKNTLLLVCLVVLTRIGFAQSTQFDFTFNHQALSVKDVNRSVEFYQKTFQLQEITNRTKNENIRWMSLGEGKELHLISNVKGPVKINKAVHLAITTQHLDEFIKWLDESKVEYSDYPGTPHKVNVRADGVKQIYLQDPDGYWIEVNNGYSAAPSIK
ncbi:MAG TPA: glyoxalase [Cytophagales bacterium]|jgi:lactoylglutathione lyase|nr:glyoxalase [Cytophagales bacterium]